MFWDRVSLCSLGTHCLASSQVGLKQSSCLIPVTPHPPFLHCLFLFCILESISFSLWPIAIWEVTYITNTQRNIEPQIAIIHICKHYYYLKDKGQQMFAGVWRKGTPGTLLVRLWIDTATVRFLGDLNRISIWHSNFSSGFEPSRDKIIHSSFYLQTPSESWLLWLLITLVRASSLKRWQY